MFMYNIELKILSSPSEDLNQLSRRSRNRLDLTSGNKADIIFKVQEIDDGFFFYY